MPRAMADLQGVMKRLRPFVGRRVAPQDVDDVLQEAMVRIHRGLPALEDGASLQAWVFQIARHAVADHHAARARHPLANTAVDDAEDPHVAEVAEDALEAAVAKELVGLVAQLPEHYRQALTLTELEGLGHAQAAARAGVSLTAMKSRVSRGRAQLRKALEDCCRIVLDARRHVVDCVPGGQAPAGCCDDAVGQ